MTLAILKQKLGHSIVFGAIVLLIGISAPGSSRTVYGSSGENASVEARLSIEQLSGGIGSELVDQVRSMGVRAQHHQFEFLLPGILEGLDQEGRGGGFDLITDEIREEFFGGMPFGSLISETASRYDVDPALVVAVITSESAFRKDASSAKGALGLMQLMPETGEWMGASDLFDPAENIDAGVRYLKYLEVQFDGELAYQLAAYNAGEGVVRRYGGIPPYRETRTYVKKVMSIYERTNQELEDFGREVGGERGGPLAPASMP